MGYNATDGEENWLEAYSHPPAWQREIILLNLNEQSEDNENVFMDLLYMSQPIRLFLRLH